MAESSDDIPEPFTVGSRFLKQYYHLLTQTPEVMFRFYGEESTFTHGVGSQKAESISGQKSINAKILEMGLKGAHVDVDSGSVDCQSSLSGGVFITVIGIITLVGKAPRPFVQSFFLALREKPGRYYVLNDCFRFLETPAVPEPKPLTPKKAYTASPISSPRRVALENQKAALSSPTNLGNHVAQPRVATPQPSPKKQLSAPSSPSPASPKISHPSPVVKSPKPASDHFVASPKAVQSPKIASPKGNQSPKPVQPVVKVATPVSSPKKPSPPSPKRAEQEPAHPEPAEVSEPVETAPSKKRWSDLFADRAAAPTQSASVRKSAPRQSKPAVATTPNTTPTESYKPAPTPVQPISLFVKNLDPDTTEEELRSLFESFGAVINVVLHTSRGHNYAFVDFDSNDSLKKALAGGPFVLQDRTLTIEERHSTGRDSRQGYRGDGSRGRGGRGGGRGRFDRTERKDNDRKDRGDRQGREDNRERRHDGGRGDRRGGRRGGRGDGESSENKQ